MENQNQTIKNVESNYVASSTTKATQSILLNQKNEVFSSKIQPKNSIRVSLKMTITPIGETQIECNRDKEGVLFSWRH